MTESPRKTVKPWIKCGIAGIAGLTIGAVASGCGGTTKTVTQAAGPPQTTTVTQTETLSSDARRSLRRVKSEIRAQEATLSRLQHQISGTRAAIAKGTFSGTGTYLVGQDIEPGTYRAAASSGCYWARLSSLNTSDIIDNDNADGPVVVEIAASDKAFEAKGCATFHRIG